MQFQDGICGIFFVMIGKTIGRYRVTRRLGEGGMGSVWLAEDPVLGRSVAIKLLPERAADSPEARERLVREARAACKLHHPGIATVYEAGEDDGRLWVAFEHVDGETVAERLQREGPLPVEEALRVAREAAAALGHAHANGILHRDVTSGNVMIEKAGRVKLVDFGLATPDEQTRRTRTVSTPGTIGYVAPEVVQGESGDRRADLWGLGVVLYEMLTGHLPFERDRAEAVVYAVVNEEPVPPREYRSDLPAEVEAVVLRALAKDPAERFADAGELSRALETGPAPALGRGETPRWRRVRWAVPAVAIAVLLAYSFLRRETTPRFDSVAVLPLSLPGENADEIAYLATGLGDALAGRLSRVSGLRVTPWVTSRRYSPDELPLPDIAAELNVESLLVGAFRQDEKGLHVTLTLWAAGTGEPAWSAKLEDTATGLLDLEDMISLAVASSVRGHLTAEEESLLVRRPTDRREAYDQYLRGAAALQRGTREATDEALARFETAVAIDSRLAEAHVGIGAVHNDRYSRGWGGNEDLAIAAESFRRALEIDPEMVAALRGQMQVSWYRGTNEDCLRIARKVRERSSAQGGVSVEALITQAWGFVEGGLSSEAVPLLRVAGQLDPANRAARAFEIVARASGGDPASAISVGEKSLRSFGETPEDHYFIGASYRCLGNREMALMHLERSLELRGDNAETYIHGTVALLHRELGNEEQARRVTMEGIRVLEARVRPAQANDTLRASLARLYAIAGDTTRVLELGREISEQSGPPATWSRWFLPFAYAEVGEEEKANRLLLEEIDRLQQTGDDRGAASGDGLPSTSNFMEYWLHPCESGVAGVGFEADAFPSLSRLPAFGDLMAAIRAERERRHALYGGS